MFAAAAFGGPLDSSAAPIHAGLGGALGLALVALAAPAIAKLVERFLPVFYVPVPALLQGVALALALGIATGGLPAWSAQRLSVVEALRRR